MHKSNSLLILALLFYFSPTAQTVKWSQQLVEKKREQYMLILGADDEDNFYLLRSNYSLDGRERSYKNKIYLLQYFTPDMNLIWEKNVETSYVDGHILDLSLINGKIVVSSYITDKKSKTYYFYVQCLDKKGLWTDKPLLLDSFTTDHFNEKNKVSMITCHDQSLMAFTYRKIDNETKAQSYRVVILDTNLVIQSKKELNVSIEEPLYVPLNFILTDRGSFFVLGIHYLTEKKVKAPEQSFYEIYGYNNVINQAVNTTIKSEGRFLTDVGITVDNSNRSLVVAGFYSDKSTYSTAGVFYYALSEDSLKESRTINTPFSMEYLQRFLNDKKENRELVNFSIDRLILRKDGGVALIAESMYETTRSYFDYYMQSYISHYYYHYGNVMVLSINPDGKILWNNVISKDQNSVDDYGYYSSYCCVVTGGKMAAIYNKYIDENASVLNTFIDATGAQKTDAIFNEQEKVTIIPKSGRQIDEETLLLPAYRQNKLYIARITF